MVLRVRMRVAGHGYGDGEIYSALVRTMTRYQWLRIVLASRSDDCVMAAIIAAVVALGLVLR